MIKGIGTDLWEKKRVEKSISKFGDKFIKKVLTEKEQKEYQAKKTYEKKVSFLSNNFACKEAVSKALGTGFSEGITLKNIEVLRESGGNPCLQLKGFNIPHISTGNILREAINAGTELGAKAKSLMDEGILVSDEVIVGVVVERIAQKDCESGFLFDGYPRTIPQAKALDINSVEINLVIEIKVPDDVIVSRMSGRRVHLSSGRNYHVDFNPPKVADVDDLTGEELIQREDDKPETVKDRLEVYRTQTLPLIDFYSERAQKGELNYLKISGVGSPTEVSDLILEKIKKG